MSLYTPTPYTRDGLYPLDFDPHQLGHHSIAAPRFPGRRSSRPGQHFARPRVCMKYDLHRCVERPSYKLFIFNPLRRATRTRNDICPNKIITSLIRNKTRLVVYTTRRSIKFQNFPYTYPFYLLITLRERKNSDTAVEFHQVPSRSRISCILQ